jgi:hypothetical protein
MTDANREMVERAGYADINDLLSSAREYANDIQIMDTGDELDATGAAQALLTLAAALEEQGRDNKALREEIDERRIPAVDALDAIWGLLEYGEEWQYPGQVAVHMRQLLRENNDVLAATQQAARAERHSHRAERQRLMQYIEWARRNMRAVCGPGGMASGYVESVKWSQSQIGSEKILCVADRETRDMKIPCTVIFHGDEGDLGMEHEDGTVEE